MQKRKQIDSPADWLAAEIMDWMEQQRKVLLRPETLYGIRTAVYHESVRIRQALIVESDRMARFCDELKNGELEQERKKTEDVPGYQA